MGKPKFKVGQEVADTIRYGRSDEHENVRHLPSVTKILQATMSVENRLRLQIWEEKMIAKIGREAFEKMKQLTFKRGHRLHSAIGKLNIVDLRGKVQNPAPLPPKMNHPQVVE